MNTSSVTKKSNSGFGRKQIVMCHVCVYSARITLLLVMVEWFLNDCRKIKTKAITEPITSTS